MAYVVLALGVLMAAIGVDAIATGYPIIQVERGWATVISGTIMLTGGLVTVALGLAVRTLAEIRAALRAQHDDLAAGGPSAVARIEPQPETPAEVLPASNAVPALAGAAAAAAISKPTEPLHDPAHDEPRVLEPVSGLIETPPVPAAEPATTSPDAEHDAAEAAEPAPDAYELQSPSTPEHDLAPDEPTRAPSEEDWLDRALSDFESGLSPTHPAEVLTPEHVTSHAAEDAAAIQAEVPPIQPEPGAAAPAEAKPAHAEPVDAAPVDAEPPHTVSEPQASPPRDPEPHDPEPHDLAVIGRYESDGTSYVMYADGSIEAQSEAGVYRFRSMAELKTFIEG